MFQIATTSSNTCVLLCQPDLAVISISYSMPISYFLVRISINRFDLAAIFTHINPDISQRIPCATMARFGEKLQNLIEPVIRDFIECMEPGTPRVEIESRHKENSCVVLIRFKKSLFEPKALFKAGFNIQSENDVRYLQRFLCDVFQQWRFFHPSQEEVSTESFSDSDSSASPSLLD